MSTTDEQNNKEPVTLGNVSCRLSLCGKLLNHYAASSVQFFIFVSDLMPGYKASIVPFMQKSMEKLSVLRRLERVFS